MIDFSTKYLTFDVIQYIFSSVAYAICIVSKKLLPKQGQENLCLLSPKCFSVLALTFRPQNYYELSSFLNML